MDPGDASPVTDSRLNTSGASLRDWARSAAAGGAAEPPSHSPPPSASLRDTADAGNDDDDDDSASLIGGSSARARWASCCGLQAPSSSSKGGSRRSRACAALPGLLRRVHHPGGVGSLLRGAAAAILGRPLGGRPGGITHGRSGGVPTRVVHVAAPNTDPTFASNRVSNTRYTPLTFLPLNLAEQFAAPLNLYFLMIAFLQLWKAITPVNPITTWAPLLLVASISAVRAALDDLRRAKADAAANARPYTVYRWVAAAGAAPSAEKQPPSTSAAHRLVEVPDCPSEAIRVGDLVRVNDDEEVPCDLVLLRSSGVVADGVVYVETANLDGETDCKPRQALSATQALAAAWVEAAQEADAAPVPMPAAQVVCDAPNPDLYTFNSVLRVADATSGSGTSSLPLTGAQLLQHGSVLRKSGWALGVAVYTGSETKMSLNRSAAPVKVGVADRFINKLTVAVFLAQLAVVAAFGAAGHRWSGNGNSAVWYLDWHADLRPTVGWQLAHSGGAGGVEGGAAGADGGSGAALDPAQAAALLADLEAVDVLPADHIAHPEEGGGSSSEGGGGSGEGEGQAAAGAASGGRRLAAAAAAMPPAGASSSSSRAGSSNSGPRLPRHTHPWYTPLILPLRFLLLSSMLVPISLRITLDLVKVVYALLIGRDEEMGSSRPSNSSSSDSSSSAGGLGPGGQPAVNNTSSLEDLGLVEVILTDKTGTLTENVMALVAVGVGGAVYGSTVPASGTGGESTSASNGASAPAAAPLASDGVLAARLSPSPSSSSSRELDLFLALAVCNSVQPEHIDTIPLAAADLQALYDRQLQRRRGSVLAVGAGGGSRGSSRAASARSGRSGDDGSSTRGSGAPPPLLAMAPSELSSVLRAQSSSSSSSSVSGVGSSNPLASPGPRGRPPRHPRPFLPASPALVLPVPVESPPPEPEDDDDAAAADGSPEASPRLAPGEGDGVSRAASKSSGAPRRYLQFASSSPDEEALVFGAASLGVTLLDRRPAQPELEPSEAGLRQWLTLALPPPSSSHHHAAPASPRVPAPSAPASSSASKRVAVSDAAPRIELGVVKTLEFTSDRKRMSTLLRVPGSSPAAAAFKGLLAGAGAQGMESDVLLLVTKGADDTVLPCLSPAYGWRAAPGAPGVFPAAASELACLTTQLASFAASGLRTLVVAARVVPLPEYTAWERQWAAAQAEVGAGRDAAVAAAAAALERGLLLVGATAIEDRLQAGVPATVTALKRAGIAWWMLTGDKTETAIQIARSTGLAGNGSGGFVIVDAPDGSETAVSASLAAAWTAMAAAGAASSGGGVETDATAVAVPVTSAGDGENLETGSSSASRTRRGEAAPLLPLSATSRAPAAAAAGPRPCLVLTGAALPHLLASPTRSATLLRLASRAEAVVCSRCSPAQKAALTRLVAASGRVTLAIGDGGNDVAMLQAAAVGVGLAGREGQQAARASDVAISRFELLARLLLVHGRLAYYRTALTAQYTFYKSACVCIFQLLFNSACAFSGCSFFDAFALTTYNMVFTFIPGLLLVLDQDRPVAALMRHPESYAEGRGAASGDGSDGRRRSPGAWLTWRTYGAWSARALYQCIVVYTVVMAGTGTRVWPFSSASTARSPTLGSSGLDAPTASYVVFTTLLLVQLITLVLTPRRPTSWNFSGATACLACYGLIFGVVARGPYKRLPLSVAGMTPTVFTDPTLLAVAGLAIVAALVPWMALEAAGRASTKGGGSNSSGSKSARPLPAGASASAHHRHH